MSSTFLRAIAFKILTVAACVSTPAHALDGMSLELGGGEGVDMVRVGLQWNWKKPLVQFRNNWQIASYWDLNFGYWRGHDVAPGEHDDLWDLGITPVMRLQSGARVGAYAEIGLGAHLLSHTSIEGRHMSTAFQVGNHLGVGYRFGPKGTYDLGYRFQHLSNASIKRPNRGINFHQIRLQYNFE
jgi:hypothetical protein